MTPNPNPTKYNHFQPPNTYPNRTKHRWRTEPEVSWDAGRKTWATAFEHSKAGEAAAAALPAGAYHLIMALPLQGVFG